MPVVYYLDEWADCPLALDRDNHPKILYNLQLIYPIPFVPFQTEVKFSEFDGAAYRKRVIFTFPPLVNIGLAWWKSLAIDHTGLNHIAYNSDSGLIYRNFFCIGGEAAYLQQLH